MKASFWGDAYLKAFRDNADKKLKLIPGYCRIVQDGLPFNLDINATEINYIQDSVCSLIWGGKGRPYYYYWMIGDPATIETFNNEYSTLWEVRNYAQMKNKIRNALHHDGEYL